MASPDLHQKTTANFFREIGNRFYFSPNGVNLKFSLSGNPKLRDLNFS